MNQPPIQGGTGMPASAIQQRISLENACYRTRKTKKRLFLNTIRRALHCAPPRQGPKIQYRRRAKSAGDKVMDGGASDHAQYVRRPRRRKRSSPGPTNRVFGVFQFRRRLLTSRKREKTEGGVRVDGRRGFVRSEGSREGKGEEFRGHTAEGSQDSSGFRGASEERRRRRLD